MAYNETRGPGRRSGAFFLIILGALMFITAPLYLADAPMLGIIVIALGFIVGGIGFYLQFVAGRARR